MSDLPDSFLALPSPPLADLARYKVDVKAAWKCGGVRRGKHGNWIVGVFADPPSIYNMVEDVVLEDFVAFNPAEPSQWRTVYSSGVAMLGEGQLDRARFRPLSDGKSISHLRVFRDPLSWVRAAGAGVCPLDLPSFARSMIGAGIKLIAEDLEHGEHLNRAIRAAVRFALPEIQVAA